MSDLILSDPWPSRRAHLKECFETLKKNVPNVDEKKTSNLSVLRSALRYIQVKALRSHPAAESPVGYTLESFSAVTPSSNSKLFHCEMFTCIFSVYAGFKSGKVGWLCCFESSKKLHTPYNSAEAWKGAFVASFRGGENCHLEVQAVFFMEQFYDIELNGMSDGRNFSIFFHKMLELV